MIPETGTSTDARGRRQARVTGEHRGEDIVQRKSYNKDRVYDWISLMRETGADEPHRKKSMHRKRTYERVEPVDSEAHAVDMYMLCTRTPTYHRSRCRGKPDMRQSKHRILMGTKKERVCEVNRHVPAV